MPEIVPAKGPQFRQRQPRRGPLPEGVPGPSQYPVRLQCCPTGHEDRMCHQAHGSRRVPEGLLDLMRVHDEERGRKWRLVFLWGIRPVVPHVGFQPSLNSPWVPRAQFVLEVERHLEVPCQHLPNSIRGYSSPAPVEGAVGLCGRDGPQQLALRRVPCLLS